MEYIVLLVTENYQFCVSFSESYIDLAMEQFTTLCDERVLWAKLFRKNNILVATYTIEEGVKKDPDFIAYVEDRKTNFVPEARAKHEKEFDAIYGNSAVVGGAN